MTIEEAYTVLSNELTHYMTTVELTPRTENQLLEALKVIKQQTQHIKGSQQSYWLDPAECGGFAEIMESREGGRIYYHFEDIGEQLFCSCVESDDAAYLETLFKIPCEMLMQFKWKDLFLFGLDEKKLIKAFINLYY